MIGDSLGLLHESRRALIAMRSIVEARGKRNVDKELGAVLAAVAEALDDHHHAPLCKANHFHGGRAPGQCTCGAWQQDVRMVNHPALGRRR